MSTTASPTPQPPAGGPPAPPPKTGSGLKIVLWIVGGFVAFGMLCIIGIMVVVTIFVHKAKQSGFDPALIQKNPGFAVAKMAVTSNPEVEMLSSNDSTGTMVVRDKKTSEVLTMKFDPEKKSMTVTDQHGKTGVISLDTLHNGIHVEGPDGKTASISADQNKVQFTDSDGKTTTIAADGQNGGGQVNNPGSTVKTGAIADKAPNWIPDYPGSNPQSVLSINNGEQQGGTSGFITHDSTDKVLSFYAAQLKAGGMTTSTTTTNRDGKVGGLVTGQDEKTRRSVMVTAENNKDGTHVSISFASKL